MIRIYRKTPKSVYAKKMVRNLEDSIKTKKLKLDDFISKSTEELKAKKTYMNTDGFWKDEHNAKMFSLYEKMIVARDKITRNVLKHNEKPDAETYVQGINGFARIKKYLDKNKAMNFSPRPSFNDPANNEYKFLHVKIYNLAREFKSKIGL